MKTNYLFSTLLSLALASPGMAQETNYQRPPAVIEEVALAKLSPIIRISDNNQWALQLERSPYRSIAKLAQPELKLAGMRISPETFNTSRQAEYTGASLMNIATQEEIKIPAKSTRQMERRSYGLATMSLLRLWFRKTGGRHRRNPQSHPVPSFKKVQER